MFWYSYTLHNSLHHRHSELLVIVIGSRRNLLHLVSKDPVLVSNVFSMKSMNGFKFEKCCLFQLSTELVLNVCLGACAGSRPTETQCYIMANSNQTDGELFCRAQFIVWCCKKWLKEQKERIMLRMPRECLVCTLVNIIPTSPAKP